MNKTLITAAAVAFSLIGTTAYAEMPSGEAYDQPQGYAGLSVSQTKMNLDDTSEIFGSSWTPKLTAINANLGVDFTPYLGLEARLGHGVSDDSKDFVVNTGSGPIDAKASIKQKLTLSAFGKAMLPFNDTFSLYGLVGVTHFKADIKMKGGGVSVTETDDETDLSYGAGGKVKLNEDVALKLEYIRLYDQDSQTIDSIYAGIDFSF